MSQSTKRIHYLDSLRIFATLGVIIIHIASQQPFYANSVRTPIWQGLNLWDSLFRFSVPIFVMISGALFLDPDRKITISHLFKKNIWRIFTAFIIWDIIYALFSYYYDGTSKMATLEILIRGYDHLWFLPMIIGLYLLVPLLREITKSIKLTKYFLILALIFSILLPTFFSFYYDLGNSIKKPILLQTVMKGLSQLNKEIYFNFTLWFVTYFIAGYYFNKINFKKNVRYIIYLLGILGIVGGFISTQYISLKLNQPFFVFYNYMSLPVALTSIALFTFFKEIDKKIDWAKDTTFKTIWLKFSELTFGIYLIHFILVHLAVHTFHVFKLINNTYIAVPIVSIVIFLLSGLFAFLLSYIPWFNQHAM